MNQPPPAGRAQRVAISAVFALNGAMFTAMFSRLPAIREDTGLSEGQLGLALLCAFLALFVAQPIGGALAARFGSRPVVLVGALGYALGLVPVALAESWGALALSFALIGAASGTLDVSMNVQGLTIERSLGRPILSTLHSAFSFGALAGAGMGALLAGAGVSDEVHLPSAGAAGVAVALLATRRLMPARADASADGPLFAVPSRALAALGAIAFCVLMAEGSTNDWAAVYLADEVGTSEGTAALGLAVFSLTMATGRLVGDRLAQALGPRTLMRAGGLLAFAGVAVVLVNESPANALAGFALSGMGLATLFPVTLRAASDGHGPPGPAVAAVSTAGYVGFLAGPPLIGGIAEIASLRAALIVLLPLGLVAAALARAVAPR